MKESETILLVEDLPEDRFFMRHALRTAGVHNPVIEAEDGATAIEYLSGLGEFQDRKKYPLPCFIITDLKMPRVGGHELLRWLSERPEFDPVPRVVISSSALEPDMRLATDLGACGYFVKPAGIAELVKIVKNLDSSWIQAHCARAGAT